MRINYQRIVHHIYHHYVAIILFSLLLTVISGYFAKPLLNNIQVDFAALLPDDYVSVGELQRIKKRVGGIGPLMVAIRGETLDESIVFLHTLADSLENNPLISSVSRGRNSDILSRNRLLYMAQEDLETIYTRFEDKVELEKLKRSPLYFSLDDEDQEDPLDFSDIEAKYTRFKEETSPDKKYYLTKEQDSIILKLYPTGVITDIHFTRALFASLDSTIAHIDPNIQYFYKGAFKTTSTQYDIILNDIKSTGLYGFLGVLLLIVIYFRQPLSVLFIALPLIMSITWTFAIAYLVIGNLNMITACLIPIIFGLGIDFGIHIFARYREARRRGRDIEAALSETVTLTGSALTTTAVTTAVAFFSLLVTDFKGFSEFGFLVGTGILFSLVTMLVICPAFIILAENLKLIRLQKQQAPQHLFKRGIYPLPRLTLVLGLSAVAFSLYHLYQENIGFEYDFHNLKPPRDTKDPVISLPEDIKEERSPAIILTENRQEAEEVVATIKANKHRLIKEQGASTVRSVKSVFSYLPENQPAKLQTIGQIKDLLEHNEDLLDDGERARIDSLRPYLNAQQLTLEDLPQHITNTFTSKSGEILKFVVINADVALRDGRNAIDFANEIGAVLTPSGKTYYASSSHIIFAETLKLMIKDAKVAIVLTLLVVTLVLFIDLRRVSDTLLVLTPLLSGLTWMIGSMYLFDIKLNLYNMVTFPIMIGIGIDNGVHIFHRYREEGTGSLRLVLRTTGMVLLATSLTTMIGFAGLVPAIHPALKSIGILSLVGLSCCLITSVTLLPALLQMRESNQPEA
jgi:hypothetical protein